MTMRPYTDHCGGMNHLVDAQIGRAFPIIHKVSQHLDAIEYVASVYESGRSRDIVLRTNTTKEWVEWQYKGDTKWTVLYRFSDLLGGNVADLIRAERELAAELDALRTKLEQDVENVSPMVAEVRATHGAVLAAKNEALAAQSSVGANVVAAERAASTAVTAGAQAQVALEDVREQTTVVADAINTVVRQVTQAVTHADRAQAAAQAAQAAQVVIQDLVPEVREHVDFTRRSIVEVAELRNQTFNSEELAGQFRNEARAALDALLAIAPDLTGRIEQTKIVIDRMTAAAAVAETALSELDSLRDEVATNTQTVVEARTFVEDVLPTIVAARTSIETSLTLAREAITEGGALIAEAGRLEQELAVQTAAVQQAADLAAASASAASVSEAAANTAMQSSQTAEATATAQAQAAEQSAAQAAASQQAAAESASSSSSDAVLVANERALAEAAATASAESNTAAANSAIAAAASATTALNAQATAVDARNFAEEFADNAGDSATLAAAAASTATNAAVLAQSLTDRAESAATEASKLITNTFRLSNLLAELTGNAEAQATAQSNLGLGHTDLLNFYIAAKS